MPGKAVPPEYTWISLARHLNTTPWDLEHAPLHWVHWAAVHLDVQAALHEGLQPIDNA